MVKGLIKLVGVSSLLIASLGLGLIMYGRIDREGPIENPENISEYRIAVREENGELTKTEIYGKDLMFYGILSMLGSCVGLCYLDNRKGGKI